MDIAPAKEADWTDAERKKLEQMQAPSLFDDKDKMSIRELEKVPFDFYYRYECKTPTGVTSHRHKIVDWEACALYRNLVRRHGRNWERPFRDQLEVNFSEKDLMFLMGTIHRFPDKWLIVSLIYPPRQLPDAPHQGTLL